MKGLLAFLAILVVAVLFTGCDIAGLTWFDVSSDAIGKSTFELKSASSGSGSFSFLILADEHFTRNDPGVWYAEQTFFNWLDAYQKGPGNLSFLVSLGDGTDDAKKEEFAYYASFLSKIESYGLGIFAVKGNHDIRPNRDSTTYWNTYVKQPLFQAFSYNGVSFYLLDTSARTMGRTQFKMLEQAIKMDAQKKIFLTHMSFYAKPDLYYYCLPDTQERGNILRLMSQYSVGLYLSGHHHSGDLVTRLSPSLAEGVLGAFHGRTSWAETTLPRWYVCTYDASSFAMNITKYEVQEDSLQIVSSLFGTFPLP